ncbi:hypothetical protein [Allokutzneria albata]|uniref:Heparin binding hemagglutinin HbhA n=1 Tax=Allokutzneria albata TaxID=211114 RepID=A0A1G9Z7F7_ALLAB|nr:hypothetical protein [Allokutzneria albata]SDN17067.1 heparin binding hemagglutinin HbhA [Allokutzneria albata]
MATLPTSEDVRKAREQAGAVVTTVLEQARTPLLAALGAGDLAAKAVADALGKAREAAKDGAEAAKSAADELPKDLSGLRAKLEPAELRKLVDAYTQAALQLYGYLAERGEEALETLRNTPQVQKALTQVEEGTKVAQGRVEEVVTDVRELADDVLGKVTRRTRSAGEKAAQATERAAEDVAEAVIDAGAEAAAATRSTTRKAATRTEAAKTGAAKPAAAKKTTKN